ncbi:MAG TPA: pectate lyase [Chitinophagaceae bacterium]
MRFKHIHRKSFSIILTSTFCFLMFACAQQKRTLISITDEPALAFPGAEGFGKYTTGGRGGEVVVVTNLNDSGEGSFRKAVQKNGPKIIVFAVSGTIHLESPLNIKGNTTIAGQTAAGDGICLADQPVKIGGDNVIIRYMRFRMGDRHQNQGQTVGAGHDDAFSAYKKKNIIIDHCSMSWSTDEVFSVYGGDSTTLQWNLISEPLNYSYHFEKGDKDFENHGYGGIWGGRHLTAHHNLFAHCVSRTPRFDGIRNVPEENVDLRNNVIYNWAQNNAYAGEGGTYNIVNNYYKYGPATSKKVQFQIVNPFDKAPEIPFGKFYVSGNYVDGSAEVTKNNWQGVKVGNNNTGNPKQVKLASPFAVVPVPTQSAEEAYQSILESVGAVLPKRDTLDQRILNEVRTRTGRIIDVQGGYPHGTSYEVSKTAWPVLQSKEASRDSDSDGMPDAWEDKNGLNKQDPADASKNSLHKHYTNIEVYINSLFV